MKRALVVAAHPDDEILGCGGTIARLADDGWDVFVHILGEGVTSRSSGKKTRAQSQALLRLKDSVRKASKVVGASDAVVHDLPDNKFDSVPLLNIVKIVEGVVSTVKPAVVFTHFAGDLNIDHRLTCAAVLTACRPLSGQPVKKIFSFPIVSSTEWNFPQTFSPNFFVDISTSFKRKVDAMRMYVSELKEFPHPRSLQGIEVSAHYWGMQVGLVHAEPFIVLRDSSGSI